MDINAVMNGLKPVQEALQRQEAERAGATCTGTAGGGAVKITLTGALGVQSVVIAPAAAAASAGDVGMLEDLVATALGDALRQYRGRYGATAEEQMQRLFAGGGAGGMGALLGMLGGR